MSDLIDYSQFFEPITEDAPCGENLEYDSQFLTLEQLTKEKPEVQFGDTVQAAVGPEWREVYVKSLELLNKSKDIRLLVWLAQSGLSVHGIYCFAEVIKLIRIQLEKFWDNLHPILDPDDNNDPTMRINALSTLADEEAILHNLRETPLTQSRSYGRFSLRDIDIATGEISIESEQESSEAPSVAVIEAALADTEPQEFTQIYQSLALCREEIIKIEQLINDKVPVASALSYMPLQKVVERAYSFINNFYQKSDLSGSDTGVGESEEGVPSSSSVANVKALNQINSTKDVIRAFDLICDYYARTEPSSPVPNIIKRARSLVGSDFVSIIKNISPDSLDNFYKISGENMESVQTQSTDE